MESLKDWLELLSYLVTVIGLPFAIVAFQLEQRKERRNERDEIFRQLSDEYANFLRLALEHSDLHLFRQPPPPLDSEQNERKQVLFGLLVSLFERAFLLLYEERMAPGMRRQWSSWEDYMREWCRRGDFRAALPGLLRGEDEAFRRLIERFAREEAGPAGPPAQKSPA
ncbi:hypothetical protein [Solimonas variicoloris]|uniref:hypothetical protein n=1 Tax=Solimonas variicoloris TaxID=254408 RepID=UPI00035D164B|nr:hypothetical protein [Solimonas variicoloris]